jgi:hypothetical protein
MAALGLRITADTSGAQSSVDALASSAKNLVNALKEAEQSGNFRDAANIGQALASATAAQNQIMATANQQLQQQQGFAGMMAQRAVGTVSSLVYGNLGAQHQGALSMAGGDVGGYIQMRKAMRENAGTAIGTGLGMVGYIAGPIAGTIATTVLSQLGQYLGGAQGRREEITHKVVQNYIDALPDIDSFYKLFGQKTADAAANNKQGLEYYNEAKIKAENTGLSTGEFIKASNEIGKYFNADAKMAMAFAEEHALWARTTGADLGTIQGLAGLSIRYKGRAGNGALSHAYGGLEASGMGEGQLNEFMQSMQSIMEDGISKGFERSSQDVAGNMALLYHLSGKSALWQGENAAMRLGTMNSAIAASTSLSTTGDMLTFSAARRLAASEKGKELMEKAGLNWTGNADLDAQQIMEMGFNPALFKEQMNLVNSYFGGNNYAKTRLFMQMFGVNNIGAAQMLKFGNGELEGKTEQEIKAIMEPYKNRPGIENYDYRTASAVYSNAVNDMKAQLIDLAKDYFNNELKLLGDMKGEVARMLISRGVTPEGFTGFTDGMAQYQYENDPKAENIRKMANIMLGSDAPNTNSAFINFQSLYHDYMRDNRIDRTEYQKLTEAINNLAVTQGVIMINSDGTVTRGAP